jgi:colanic acid/amylovoran biosynthesis glycosyltransferase
MTFVAGAGVACLIGQRLGLPYAVWADRVESRVVEFQSKSKFGLRKLYTLAVAKVMARYERFLIGRATLGLFNGMECYDAYAKYCSNSHVVHDIHLAAAARISDRDLNERLSRPGPPLRLVYAGRVHLDKGVFGWIEALTIAARDNIDFTAVWYRTRFGIRAGAGRATPLVFKNIVSRRGRTP